MKFLGKFSLKNDENYRAFLTHVLTREEGTALITVANHRSILDDPALMANLLPYWMGIQPRYIRWNICTQNMCFQVRSWWDQLRTVVSRRDIPPRESVSYTLSIITQCARELVDRLMYNSPYATPASHNISKGSGEYAIALSARTWSVCWWPVQMVARVSRGPLWTMTSVDRDIRCFISVASSRSCHRARRH